MRRLGSPAAILFLVVAVFLLDPFVPVPQFASQWHRTSTFFVSFGGLSVETLRNVPGVRQVDRMFGHNGEMVTVRYSERFVTDAELVEMLKQKGLYRGTSNETIEREYD